LRVRTELLWEVVEVVFELALSLFLGFVVGVVVLQLLGVDPFEYFRILVLTGFSDIGDLLSKATPLIATGLAFALPALAGLFNIGGEGQLFIGALASLAVAYFSSNPLLALIAGTAAGTGLGLIVGILRAYRDVNEVVSSIMLNWIVYYMTCFVLTVYLYNPIYPQNSVEVPPSARLAWIGSEEWSVPSCFIVAVLICIAMHLLLYRTPLGYTIRLVGYSIRSAKYVGIDHRKVWLYSMALGGALAGLGGALYVLGVVYYVDTSVHMLEGLGFTGIGVALIARLQPLAIPIAAIFISGLMIGSSYVQVMGVPPELAQLVIGIIIVALSAPYAYRYLLSVIRTRTRLGKL